MGDDITLNSGSGGAIVSTEQLTSGGDSSHAQRIKLITGAAHVDGGDVTASNGLPVAQVDNAGNVLGTAAHPTQVQNVGVALTPFGTSNAPASSGTAKSSPGNLRSIYVENTANVGTAMFLWICDQNGGAPLAANLKLAPLLIPAGGAAIYDDRFFGAAGLACTTGITWGISTSKTTYTQDTNTHSVAGMVL